MSDFRHYIHMNNKMKRKIKMSVVFWPAVIFGGKHAYWMNVRKMLSGTCIIDRTEQCKILNTC